MNYFDLILNLLADWWKNILTIIGAITVVLVFIKLLFEVIPQLGKTKTLSNNRNKGDTHDELLKEPKIMGLEQALEYIKDDELVEVTPKNIRIRKVFLDEISAKRAARKEKAEQ